MYIVGLCGSPWKQFNIINTLQTWFSIPKQFFFPPQDLRNYQYSLSVVEGLRIHMEMGHSYIDIPKSSFTEVREL